MRLCSRKGKSGKLVPLKEERAADDQAIARNSPARLPLCVSFALARGGARRHTSAFPPALTILLPLLRKTLKLTSKLLSGGSVSVLSPGLPGSARVVASAGATVGVASPGGGVLLGGSGGRGSGGGLGGGLGLGGSGDSSHAVGVLCEGRRRRGQGGRRGREKREGEGKGAARVKRSCGRQRKRANEQQARMGREE